MPSLTYDDLESDLEDLLADWMFERSLRASRRITSRLPSCQICRRIDKNSLRAGRYTRVCSTCFKNQKFCKECGSAYQDRDCPTCTTLYVPNHRYAPTFKPRTAKNEAPNHKQLLFGVELEVETPEKIPLAKEVDHEYTWAYVKHDGSVGYGMEINTQPFTWAWLKENIEDIEALFETMSLHRAEASTQCGLHIHMNRQAFTKTLLYKIIKLLYENQSQVIFLSGRTNLDWIERYASFNREGGASYIEKASYQTGDRYAALNTSSNKTIELRIFAGTTDFQRFLACIQFCHAMFYYATETSLNNINWTSFNEWVSNRRDSYENLIEALP